MQRDVFNLLDFDCVIIFLSTFLRIDRDRKQNQTCRDDGLLHCLFRIFKNIKYPLIKIVDSDNFEDILKESIEMRNRIRGEDVGGLG